MAVIPHESFRPPPDPSGGLWRYMSFPAYAWMLRKAVLHLTRVDRFDRDPHDGALTELFDELDVVEIVNRSKREGRPLPGPHRSRFDDESRAALRRSFAVNCWCMGEAERMSLWERYGMPYGVAVRTTYDRLSAALAAGGGPPVWVGCVHYRRPKLDRINVLDYLLLKRQAFEDEAELRVVRWAMPEREGNSTSFPAEGVDVPVDLGRLIERVVAGPPWQPWFHELVAGTTVQHGIDPSLVTRSSLMDPPRKTIAGQPALE